MPGLKVLPNIDRLKESSGTMLVGVSLGNFFVLKYFVSNFKIYTTLRNELFKYIITYQEALPKKNILWIKHWMYNMS